MTEQWLQRALNLAQGLFLALASLELVVSGWVYWTRRDQQDGDFVGTLAVKLGVLAFVLGIITTYAHWAPLVPYQMGLLATEIGGREVADLSVTGAPEYRVAHELGDFRPAHGAGSGHSRQRRAAQRRHRRSSHGHRQQRRDLGSGGHSGHAGDHGGTKRAWLASYSPATRPLPCS